MLAQSEVYLGSPDGHLRTQQTIIDAAPADLRDAAVDWLSRGGPHRRGAALPRLRRGGDLAAVLREQQRGLEKDAHQAFVARLTGRAAADETAD